MSALSKSKVGLSAIRTLLYSSPTSYPLPRPNIVPRLLFSAPLHSRRHYSGGTSSSTSTPPTSSSSSPSRPSSSSCFSSSSSRFSSSPLHHRVVIIGGGAGGLTVAARLQHHLKYPNSVAIVEPSSDHYYQAYFTLVGGGQATISDCRRPTSSLLPRGAEWYRSRLVGFRCHENAVDLSDGSSLHYDVLVVAMGIHNDWSQIRGLREALQNPEETGVVTNYGPEFCVHTWKAVQRLQKGSAVFTMPSKPLKCPGAPQKIMFLAEDYWRQQGRRQNISVKWMSGLLTQFAVPVYAESLIRLCDGRDITREYKRNLVEVRAKKKEAVFEVVGGGGKGEETCVVPYDFLHVGPPQCPPDVLRKSPLANSAGFMAVDKHSMLSDHFPNVFGIGDCTSIPTSRTAAAVAAESHALVENVKQVLEKRGGEMEAYNGYASCPLVCGKNECIMAEFNSFEAKPLETFPFDQSVPRRSMFWMKKYALPIVYWNGTINGIWNGPEAIRKLFAPIKRLIQ